MFRCFYPSVQEPACTLQSENHSKGVCYENVSCKSKMSYVHFNSSVYYFVFFFGCGEVDDNTQPALGVILDQTLDVGNTTRIEINIIDADVDDTHTISASSDAPAIATVSVNNTILIITGIAEGMTTLTVSATDDSGQDNAEATPVTFRVAVEKNSQPVIEAISDQTLEVDDKTAVEINVTDADIEDTHIINASSDDTAIATVSVNNTTLTITGIAGGMTTITVSATDDSGQDNAEATPETFEVTVRGNTVPRDPAFSDLLEASANGNDDLVEELFNRATKLRVGLEFPRDTFAVNEEHTVLVAHTDEGKGLVLIGRTRLEAGGNIQLGWLTFVKRGALRVLTHYDP